MKKNLTKINVLAVLVAAFVISLTSCMKEECNFGEKNSDPQNGKLVVGLIDDKVIVVDPENGNTYRFDNIDGPGNNGSNLDGIIGKDDANNPGSPVYVVFGDDDKVKSITTNGMTYVFRDREGKIDVLLYCDGSSFIRQDVANVSPYSSLPSDSRGAKLRTELHNVVYYTNVIDLFNNMIMEDSENPDGLSKTGQIIDELRKDATNMVVVGDDVDNGKVILEPGKFFDEIGGNQPGGGNSDSNFDEFWKNFDGLIGDTKDDGNDNTDKGESTLESGIGALKVTLSWFYTADIDLHAFEPVTEEQQAMGVGHIFYNQSRNSITDGFLDIDNTYGYYIDPVTHESNTSRGAIENIYWENPAEGRYDIMLDYFSGVETGKCDVEIFYNGKGTHFSADMTPAYNHSNGMRDIAVVSIPDGNVIPANVASPARAKAIGAKWNTTFPAKK